MSEMYATTVNTRDAECKLCGLPVKQRESVGLYGGGSHWITVEHDAPCGRPCMGARVFPKAVRERFGLHDYSIVIHGGMDEDRMRRCPLCGDLGVAPPPAPIVDPHENGGGFDELADADEIERLRDLVTEVADHLRGEDADPDGAHADEYIRRAGDAAGADGRRERRTLLDENRELSDRLHEMTEGFLKAAELIGIDQALDLGGMLRAVDERHEANAEPSVYTLRLTSKQVESAHGSLAVFLRNCQRVLKDGTPIDAEPGALEAVCAELSETIDAICNQREKQDRARGAAP